MGRKDIGLKSYFRDSVRYADLWNGSVFQGRQVVRAEELQEITPVHLKSDREAVLERTGDLVMMQSGNGGRYAVLALENQEKIDYGMPARIMIQEALEYDRQMKEIRLQNERTYKRYCKAERKEAYKDVYGDEGEYLYKFRRKDRLYPVATLVVYWGEGQWKGAKSLHEMMDFDNLPAGEELKRLIPEYPLHFLDLSSFEHIEYFKTELRPLFGLFQRRNSKAGLVDYIRENEENLTMDDESWYMLGEMIGSKNISGLIQTREQKDRRNEKMGNAFDELIEERIAEGQAEGKLQGRAEGKIIGKAESIMDLLEEFGSVPDRLREAILEQTEISVLKDWLKLAAHTKSIDEFARLSHLM